MQFNTEALQSRASGLSTSLAVMDSSTGSDGWSADRNTQISVGLYTNTATKGVFFFMHLCLKSDSLIFNYSHLGRLLGSPGR